MKTKAITWPTDPVHFNDRGGMTRCDLDSEALCRRCGVGSPTVSAPLADGTPTYPPQCGAAAGLPLAVAVAILDGLTSARLVGGGRSVSHVNRASSTCGGSR